MSHQNHYESPDYYLLDELLTEEHLLIRKTIRIKEHFFVKSISFSCKIFARKTNFFKKNIKISARFAEKPYFFKNSVRKCQIRTQRAAL